MTNFEIINSISVSSMESSILIIFLTAAILLFLAVLCKSQKTKAMQWKVTKIGIFLPISTASLVISKIMYDAVSISPQSVSLFIMGVIAFIFSFITAGFLLFSIVSWKKKESSLKKMAQGGLYRKMTFGLLIAMAILIPIMTSNMIVSPDTEKGRVLLDDFSIMLLVIFAFLAIFGISSEFREEPIEE